MSEKDFKRLEKEIRILRRQNEELQDLLEGIYENEKIGGMCP